MTDLALQSSASALLICFITAVIVWLATVVVYRRFFHPLAKIPGPLLASITHLYIVKFNLFSRRSQLYLQIEKLHREYGPVIRVSPDEIHLSDPDNYEKVYFVGSKAPSKAGYFYNAFGLKTAAFGTPSNELHRVRRAAINPLFSRKAVLELEDIVQSKAGKLARRMNEVMSEGKPVDLHHGFRALAVDVITDYAFDNCYNQLDTPNFAADFFEMTSELAPRGWVLQAFPLLLPLSNLITLGMAKKLNVYLYNFLQFRKRCVNEVAAMKQNIDEGRDSSQRKTIFHQLLNPNATAGHIVPSVEDLTDEAFTILSAAADTTGHAMAIITFFVVSNPAIYGTLTAELQKAFPNRAASLDFLTLEKLPYLTAVIKEGLRLSYGVPGRLPRVIETPEALFNGYRIPRGTIVGMSAWVVHRDISVFPDPDAFLPDRWLEPDKAKKLDKYLVSFSKGSRQCVGMQLAYSELYITIGTVFRQFESLRVFETTPADLEFDDFFGAFYAKDSRRLHVTAGLG